jgi:hypothetical protein
VFIAVFLVVRYLSQRRPPSRGERLSYAYGALTDLAAGRLGARHRRRALDLVNDDDRLVREVRALLTRAPAPTRPPSRWTRLTRLAGRSIAGLYTAAAHPAVRRAVLGLFFVLAAGVVAATVAVLVRRGDRTPPLNAVTIGTAVTVLAVGACSLLGVVQLLRGARVTALRLFRWATLVALFVGQFVAFITLQLFALTGLAVNLIVLAALRVELTVEAEGAAGGGTGRRGHQATGA